MSYLKVNGWMIRSPLPTNHIPLEDVFDCVLLILKDVWKMLDDLTEKNYLDHSP